MSTGQYQKRTTSSTLPANSHLQSRPFGSQSAITSGATQEIPTIQKQSETNPDSSNLLEKIEITPRKAIQPKKSFGKITNKSDFLPSIQRNKITGNQNLLQRDNSDDNAADQISTQDIEYEIIAHRFAYQESLPGAAGDWLDSRGYERNWRQTHSGTGFFVGLLMPKPNSGKRAILAFKGTTPTNAGDILADVDPIAVGFTAFQLNKNAVKQMINQAQQETGQKVDITGHSLGGALSQHAASEFPSDVNRVVAFQAPGISQEQVRQFNNLSADKKPDITYHLASGDVVDVAGGKHLGGSGIYTGKGNAEFFMHDVGNSPGSHTQYLLSALASPEQRQELGLTDEVLENLGISDKLAKHSGTVKHFDDYPHWFKQFLTERVRELPGAVLGTVAAGGIAAVKGAKAAGSAIASGAEVAGNAIVSGAKATGSAIASGAEVAGNAIVSGAKATGSAIASGVSSLYQTTRKWFS